MTRFLKRTRAQKYPQNYDRFWEYAKEVDENIVSILTGKTLRYDQYRHVLYDSDPGDDSLKYSKKDSELYEIQRDLFWWYCKQDVYHSTVAGGALLWAIPFETGILD
jgi:hypothetical protein